MLAVSHTQRRSCVACDGAQLPHSTDLPELLVDKCFDDEQVWTQLEADNRLNIDSAVKNAATLLVQSDSEFFGIASLAPSDVTDDESEPEETLREEEDEEHGDVEANSDDDEISLPLEDRRELGSEDDEDEEELDEREETAKPSRVFPKSVVDDKFFRLEEMNDFLLENERQVAKPDEEIDYFVEEDSESEREDVKYDDFFDPPPDVLQKEQREEKDKVKSTFEKRQEKLKTKIQAMEEEAVSERPWQLSGEVAASKRPENSLLEEFLQFDHVTRRAPVITEEVTQTLESLILQRVKDKAFDDVQRKTKPKDVDPYEYKKKLILDDSKPKMSLSQTYEQEYLKKTAKTEQTEKEEHRKIRSAINELFVKLDALSNFHFVPKPVAPDIKIINNLPTIVVEEVQPSVVSTGQLLAPEEVQAKRKEELKGATEATRTDKKRARRKKKGMQKMKAHHQKEKIKDKDAENKKRDKLTGKAGGSSTAFFNKLQDTIKTEMHAKNGEKSKKRKNDLKKIPGGKKIKL
ncbi:U3 small nucleolar ribonucleoprotein protein MPP10-like isoform X2 [Paramacrobiotus metropolitanus]|uniref:U3 small nucleolar ribonucleoprotein protein MPP10-like isoform X2 n=1 Tax=Paramacrobiotus metropolitanus TaxID=2943436 RepID=UPI0024465CF3|nr:U3 small nucleolar ribonucleoprotein protein MPP10-like isoform X2 [Paramacrobiotus metropolitanus]